MDIKLILNTIRKKTSILAIRSSYLNTLGDFLYHNILFFLLTRKIKAKININLITTLEKNANFSFLSSNIL